MLFLKRLTVKIRVSLLQRCENGELILKNGAAFI